MPRYRSRLPAGSGSGVESGEVVSVLRLLGTRRSDLSIFCADVTTGYDNLMNLPVTVNECRARNPQTGPVENGSQHD